MNSASVKSVTYHGCHTKPREAGPGSGRRPDRRFFCRELSRVNGKKRLTTVTIWRSLSSWASSNLTIREWLIKRCRDYSFCRIIVWCRVTYRDIILWFDAITTLQIVRYVDNRRSLDNYRSTVSYGFTIHHGHILLIFPTKERTEEVRRNVRSLQIKFSPGAFRLRSQVPRASSVNYDRQWRNAWVAKDTVFLDQVFATMYAPILVRFPKFYSVLRDSSNSAIEQVVSEKLCQPLYSSNSQLLQSSRYHGIINSQSKYLVCMHHFSPFYCNVCWLVKLWLSELDLERLFRSSNRMSPTLIWKDHPSLHGRHSCASRMPSPRIFRPNQWVHLYNVIVFLVV